MLSDHSESWLHRRDRKLLADPPNSVFFHTVTLWGGFNRFARLFASLRSSSPMKDLACHPKASKSSKRPCAGRTRKSTERSNRQEANKMLALKVVLDMHFRFFLGDSDIPRRRK